MHPLSLAEKARRAMYSRLHDVKNPKSHVWYLKWKKRHKYFIPYGIKALYAKWDLEPTWMCPSPGRNGLNGNALIQKAKK